MLEEMEEGGFKYLEVASGGAIHKELPECGERSGYPEIEDTRKFFEEIADLRIWKTPF